MFTERSIPVEVDPIIAGNGPATVELLGEAAFGPLALDPRTLGPLDPLAVEPLGALDALAFNPGRTFRALDALAFRPLRTLCALEMLALDAILTLCALDSLTLDALRALGPLNPLPLDPLRPFCALESLPLDPLRALGALNARTLRPLRTFNALGPLLALGPLRTLCTLLALSFALLAALARLSLGVAITATTFGGSRRGHSQGGNSGNQKILASHIILLAKIKSLECQRIGLEDEPVPHMNLPVPRLAWSWCEGG